MKVKGIVWLGTRTARFAEMLNMYHKVMGYFTYQNLVV